MTAYAVRPLVKGETMMDDLMEKKTTFLMVYITYFLMSVMVIILYFAR